MIAPWQNRPFKERCLNDRILRLHSIFLIGKRTLRDAPAKGRYWPKAAVALKSSRMSAMGQQRTSSALPLYVRFWGLSGHPMSALPPIADIGEGIAECPLMTQSGHS